MTTEHQAVVESVVVELKAALGDNLHSCCLYGSAVRGNHIPRVSDVNLLIVLNESTPAAHNAIANVVSRRSEVDQFVLARRGFERSVQAFASKFASIQRNYRVLHGADPLAGIKVEPDLERFLCEQALRNLRLRLVYAFITRQRTKVYDKFLARSVTPLFVQLAETLRLQGISVPKDFAARVAVFEKEFGVKGESLRALLEFKARPSRLNDEEQTAWHERIFALVDKVVTWIEAKWKPYNPRD